MMRYKDRNGNLIIKETGQDRFLRALYTRRTGRASDQTSDHKADYEIIRAFFAEPLFRTLYQEIYTKERNRYEPVRRTKLYFV